MMSSDKFSPIVSMLSLAVVLWYISSYHAVYAKKQEYAMYVRRHVFDVDAEYCKGVYPVNQTGNNMLCFQHSWDKPAARYRLWESCTIQERQIGRIFLSDVKNRIQHDGFLDTDGTCDADLIATLEEAHSIGVEVYALFAVSDAGVREQELVGLANAFNTNCSTDTGMFDGVSIKNEYFTKIKKCDMNNEAAQLEFLDNLRAARHNALPLPIHYSVSWTWDCCSCSSSDYVPRELTWNGSKKSAVEHMIDIADSIDVQVAWNRGNTMAQRALRPYQYWLANKAGMTATTAFYVLAYTTPNRDCRLSFAPHRKGSNVASDSCSTGDRTEAGMFAAFDEVEANMSDSRGAIQFMGGVFSSGMPGWPKHGALSPTPSPTPLLPGPPLPPSPNNSTGAGYGMYVWRKGFDANSEYCNGIYPAKRNATTVKCFHHAWRNPSARSRLWSSCKIPGREIGRIFLSDVTSRIQNGGYSDASGTCDGALIKTLEEAHEFGVQVYALFAADDASFREQDLVGLANDFNRNCGTDTGKFDGVSVNNEHFGEIKRCISANEAAQLGFLDDLQTARDNAHPLPLHFSVSWNWDCCTCSSANYVRRELDWNGSTKSALEHMIDIADSVDVQVAWNKLGSMRYRASRPYQYWLANKKGVSATSEFYVLAYTNPNADCRQSFAPHVKGSTLAADYCVNGDRTEAGMFAAFDGIQSSMTHARGGINFMGGVFSSGMQGWPKH